MILNFIIFFKSKRNSINKLINRLQNLEKKSSIKLFLPLPLQYERKSTRREKYSFFHRPKYVLYTLSQASFLQAIKGKACVALYTSVYISTRIGGTVNRLCVPAAFARVHARRGARARTVAVPASFPRPRESAV